MYTHARGARQRTSRYSVAIAATSRSSLSRDCASRSLRRLLRYSSERSVSLAGESGLSGDTAMGGRAESTVAAAAGGSAAARVGEAALDATVGLRALLRSGERGEPVLLPV